MNIENSRSYYGQILKQSSDLRTDACCTLESPSLVVRAALANIHDEVKARYFGCGLVVPQAIEGAHILDLGSGSGQDAYLLAQLVGEAGSVTGIDATPEQLDVAERHLDWHRNRFGFARSNVRFIAGDIERLGDLDLPAGGFDVIVSNCVINLVADKAGVFAAAHRLLKPGGELYFSDVYADRRVPQALLTDPVMHGECLSGALYWGDFDRLAKAAGFVDPRLVSDRPLGIGDDRIAALLDGIAFHSATYRLFKLEGLESAMRGLRPGRALSRHRSRMPTRVRARRAPCDRDRTPVPGLRQHLEDARRNTLCIAFRFPWGFLAPFRHLSRLRHLQPVPPGE